MCQHLHLATFISQQGYGAVYGQLVLLISEGATGGSVGAYSLQHVKLDGHLLWGRDGDAVLFVVRGCHGLVDALVCVLNVGSPEARADVAREAEDDRDHGDEVERGGGDAKAKSPLSVERHGNTQLESQLTRCTIHGGGPHRRCCATCPSP